MNKLTAIQEIFRDVFDEDCLVITEQSNSDSIEDWDSLAHIRLVIAIEKCFQIKFNLAELQELKNVGDMIKLIEKKL